MGVLLVLFWSAGPAWASGGQSTMLQDNRLLLSDPGHLDQTLRTLSSLGVQRLRISVQWAFLAPDAGSSHMPAGFDGANPADYPPGAWAPYDAVVRAAARYKLGVNFNLTGGAPLWAEPAAPPLANVWYPSASAFGAFVRAVGLRYSGSYPPPGASAPLPRVGYWSVWNEPNVGASSLAPQTVNGVEVGPRLYRGLLDAAYSALQGTGHGGDTILIGELASTGHADPGSFLGMQPLRFVRALYCVNGSFRQLRGAAAAALGCPTTAAASARFRAQNPALFQATGWSHHPYHLTAPPDARAPRADPDWVTLADLSKLESALDRIQRVYGSHKRFPIYLTEYGYDTNPPQAGSSVSLGTQAAYLNQAEYIAWRDPRVQTLSQYLLRDQPLGYGAQTTTYVSGLEFLNGKPKPSFAAYRLPIWLPNVRTRRGRALEVWGCVRPAKLYSSSAVGPVQIQLNGRTIRSVKVTNPNGYFDVHVAFPGSGNVRLAWNIPHGARIYSRTVRVTG
ncbi:MAG: hypothetical protein JO363_01255 [Solirubrobacterales bacterium]|nr:hypothetical protein [Solirubrobacterales bacterium]